ncbi:hypothetical protein CJO75_12655 [Ralstonia solanacearum]|nr:hypothetical protein CJO75_12655 [Ralstonia solanacearum]AXW15593.1 hypothetical protein CJO84_12860 [Ralstonia solanacearum]AXW39142.1 hypothetical protein CJO89_13230 [Ralstonia solanacearum]AXW71925.1 hypothetical protein CJO96_12690 [Ralstonia solanacearum]
MPKRAQLRIHGFGDVEVRFTTEFLVDLEKAYDSIFLFESLMDDIGRFPRYLDVYPADRAWWLRHRLGNAHLAEVATEVPLADRLVLSGVRLNSPGFWHFLGALNPLEVIRNYLNDRHERRKDRDYRESAEHRRLQLENLKRENEVIADRIRLARDLGATDRDLAAMLDQFVHRPLLALDRHQDRGVIERAEVVSIADEEKKVSD